MSTFGLVDSSTRRLGHPLTPVLQSITPACCPSRVNLHCHTHCSDGSLAPQQLASQAVAIGLEHLAVTDHHSVRAHDLIARGLASAAEAGTRVPVLWRGVEISALLDGCLVHVLALGFGEQHRSLEPYLQGSSQVGDALRAESVVTAIHEAGGLALLAHPARYRLSFARLIDTAAQVGFDGAEAWYDYTMASKWQDSELICPAIASLLSERGLLMSCGTDTHGLDLCGR